MDYFSGPQFSSSRMESLCFHGTFSMKCSMDTLWRGPGRYKVPTPNNTMKLNWVIEPSGSQETHTNYSTEKHCIMDSTCEQDSGKMKSMGQYPQDLWALRAITPLRHNGQKKGMVPEAGEHGCLAMPPADRSSPPSRVRGESWGTNAWSTFSLWSPARTCHQLTPARSWRTWLLLI